MKVLFVMMILLFSSFTYSQTKEDYQKIIEMVVNEKDDTLKNVYYQFDNKLLIEELENCQRLKDQQFFSYYEKHKDSLDIIEELWVINNIESLDTCSYFGVSFIVNKALDICRKTDGKRIRPYYKSTVSKNKKAMPLMRVSLPIFSIDGTMAVANYDYRCKGYYCADTQFFIFKKINNVWEIVGTGPVILY